LVRGQWRCRVSGQADDRDDDAAEEKHILSGKVGPIEAPLPESQPEPAMQLEFASQSEPTSQPQQVQSDALGASKILMDRVSHIEIYIFIIRQ